METVSALPSLQTGYGNQMQQCIHQSNLGTINWPIQQTLYPLWTKHLQIQKQVTGSQKMVLYLEHPIFVTIYITSLVILKQSSNLLMIFKINNTLI